MMCPYAEHDLCQIATRLANVPVRLNTDACKVCAKQAVKFAPNRVTAALALHATQDKGEPDLYLLHMATNSLHLPGNTLQRYVHKWLRRLRISTNPNPSCGCDSLVARMNHWGVEECLNRIDEIVDQLFTNLQTTYLAGVAIPFLTIPLIRSRVRKCLLSARSSSR